MGTMVKAEMSTLSFLKIKNVDKKSIQKFRSIFFFGGPEPEK